MPNLIDEFLDLRHKIRETLTPVQDEISDLVHDVDSAYHKESTALRQKPKAVPSLCARTRGNGDTCGLCEKLCPVHAIELSSSSLAVSEHCIGCGICSAICPCDALVSYAHTPTDVFDSIGKNSALWRKSYIACDKARVKGAWENVYRISCLGAISHSEWAFIMSAYNNVSLYIPEGLCEGCEVGCGETLFRTQIREAEKSAQYMLGLERESVHIDRRLKPEVERDDLTASVSKNRIDLNIRTQYIELIEEQKRSFKRLDEEVRSVYSATSQQGISRKLSNDRKFDILARMVYPTESGCSSNKTVRVDPELCVGCTRCAEVCPQGACEVDRRGSFHVIDMLCVGCGACVGVCDESALAIICKKF